MAPKLTEEEIDDLIYFSRAGEQEDLTETIKSLAERENASPAEIVAAAQDASNKSTCLHMATGNGHLGKKWNFGDLEAPYNPDIRVGGSDSW